MSDTKNTENESSGLKKSLRLIYVYAIAAGAIFTFSRDLILTYIK